MINIIAWIIFGGLAGWVASLLVGEGASLLGYIVVGIIGSWLGGWIMNKFGKTAPTGFNIQSFLVAVLGSVVILAIVALLF